MKKRLIGWLAALALLVSGCGASASQIMKAGATAQQKQSSVHMNISGTVGYQGASQSIAMSADYAKKPLQLLANVKLQASGTAMSAGLYLSKHHFYLKSVIGGWQDLSSQLGQNLDLNAIQKASGQADTSVTDKLMKQAKVDRTPQVSTITLNLKGKAAQAWLKQALRLSTKTAKQATKTSDADTQKELTAALKALKLKSLDLRLAYDHHTKLPKTAKVKLAIAEGKHAVTLNLTTTYSKWGKAKVVAPQPESAGASDNLN